MNEREDRKKNVVIKGVEVREGRRKEAVEEILSAIGKSKDSGDKRLGGEMRKNREMLRKGKQSGEDTLGRDEREMLAGKSGFELEEELKEFFESRGSGIAEV